MGEVREGRVRGRGVWAAREGTGTRPEEVGILVPLREVPWWRCLSA